MPLGIEARSHGCQRRFGRQRQYGGPVPPHPGPLPKERENYRLRGDKSRHPDFKSEIRRSKAERRPKVEIRSPKPDAERGSGFGLRPSTFGFRPTTLDLRPSNLTRSLTLSTKETTAASRTCNPKGIVSSSPRLRAASYPGLASVRFSTPTGVVPSLRRRRKSESNPNCPQQRHGRLTAKNTKNA